MTSNGGEEGPPSFQHDTGSPLIEKLLSTGDFPNNVHETAAEPSNDGHGHGHPGVSAAHNNNPQVSDYHQSAQPGNATLHAPLSEPPCFHGEAELVPQMRASSVPTSNFADDQASTHEIYYLELTGRPFQSFEIPCIGVCITGAPQPPSPLPLINSQLLQHHQIPPANSTVPMCSSNGNLMDSISTTRRSANRLLPSPEDSQISDYSDPQPSSSFPTSQTTIDLELRLGHSAPSSGAELDLELRLGHSAHDATTSSYSPDDAMHRREEDHHDNHLNTMMASDDPFGVDIAHHAHTTNNQAISNQSGLASLSDPYLDLLLGPPSSSSHYPVTDDHAGHRSDDERHNNGNNEQLVVIASNEPSANDVDAHDGHDGTIDAERVSNPQERSSSSSAPGE